MANKMPDTVNSPGTNTKISHWCLEVQGPESFLMT